MGIVEEAVISLSASAIATKIHGVKIIRKVSDASIAQLGVTSWIKWESDSNKFPWTFKNTEIIYLVEGKVKVNVEGHGKEEEVFEIGKGDVVVFSKDLKCVLEITEAVKKYYTHDE